MIRRDFFSDTGFGIDTEGVVCQDGTCMDLHGNIVADPTKQTPTSMATVAAGSSALVAAAVVGLAYLLFGQS
jgi:hypothetical protein